MPITQTPVQKDLSLKRPLPDTTSLQKEAPTKRQRQEVSDAPVVKDSYETLVKKGEEFYKAYEEKLIESTKHVQRKINAKKTSLDISDDFLNQIRDAM